jgi:hypothetical protein
MTWPVLQSIGDLVNVVGQELASSDTRPQFPGKGFKRVPACIVFLRTRA